MKERPILFSGPMVRAILEGRKTQTRRVVKPQPIQPYPEEEPSLWRIPNGLPIQEAPCPYGKPGDLLWVRETFSWVGGGASFLRDLEFLRSEQPINLIYKADGFRVWDWTPSIHMPRWASRLTLRITDVHVERLQDISEEDARAEGAYPIQVSGTAGYDDGHKCVIAGFERIWDGINGKTHPWRSNPWVWVIAFERVEVPD